MLFVSLTGNYTNTQVAEKKKKLNKNEIESVKYTQFATIFFGNIISRK